MFGIILISICTIMQVYVFYRAASVPFIASHLSRNTLVGTGLLLWIILFTGRMLAHNSTRTLAGILEFMGMIWLGVLFLTFICFFTMDVLTGFGFFMPRVSPVLRGWALLVGLILSAMALFQGIRPPVVENYEVTLPNLPQEMDGTVIIGLADLHLGSQIGKGWLAARMAQVQAENPDLVVLLGDIFEGHAESANPFLDEFKKLMPPLGVWAVAGNHDFYGGHKLNLFQAADIKLLRNKWVQLKPGLVLAGVDDLTHSLRHGRGNDLITRALKDHPPGTVILLSHSPLQAETAAREGVSLMLSGHTHGGQIWPFGYLVKRAYPLLKGRYVVDGMIAIVCRGTGTWGPRMRLWPPGEILRLTLRRD